MRFRILDLALREAQKSNIYAKGMGCVIFKGKQVISRGYNQVYDRNTIKPKAFATMHAEMTSIENLARKLNMIKDLRKLLVNTKVYNSSLNARIQKSCRKGR
jgi:tRNA(Arg) A34 adenosine deaminase TadA